jgi:DHA2 family multidrug resistance protein-like MFS transporter
VTTEAPPKAGRREWLGLAVLALPTMLLSLDISVLFLAVPHLTADLSATSTQQLWITDIYGFMTAGFLVTMGTLGDRIGRRKLLLVGAAAFSGASVLAAYSTSPEMLVVARALMGIAGATILPSTMALISNMFRDQKQMAAALAVWGSAFMAGVAFGPVIGGAMLASFWWGSVFLMGLPVLVLLLVAGPFLLPEYRDPNASGRIDMISVGLSLLAMLPVIYGLKEIARDGWQALPIVLVLVGIAFGVLFVLRQRRLVDPLLDLRLFAIRAVSIAVLIGLFVAITQSGTGLVIALQLQMVEGLSPLQAGLWLIPPAIALVLGINMSQGIARKVPPGYVIAGGFVISIIGQLLLTQVDASGSLTLIVVGLAVVYFGVGPGAALINQLVLSNAPPERAGSASSLASTSGELGVALGIAVLGTVASSVYRTELTVPAGASPEVSAAATESIAGAVANADQLPAPIGAELLASARDAFTTGLHGVALVCAVLVAGLAIVSATGLRHVPPIGEQDPHADAEPAPEAAEAADTDGVPTTPSADKP